MIKRIFLGLFLLQGCAHIQASTEILSSPDGRIRLEVCTDGTLRMSVFYGAEQVVDNSPLCLLVQQEWLGVRPKLKGVRRQVIDRDLPNVVPVKNAVTHDEALETMLRLVRNGGWCCMIEE